MQPGEQSSVPPAKPCETQSSEFRLPTSQSSPSSTTPLPQTGALRHAASSAFFAIRLVLHAARSALRPASDASQAASCSSKAEQSRSTGWETLFLSTSSASLAVIVLVSLTSPQTGSAASEIEVLSSIAAIATVVIIFRMPLPRPIGLQPIGPHRKADQTARISTVYDNPARRSESCSARRTYCCSEYPSTRANLAALAGLR